MGLVQYLGVCFSSWRGPLQYKRGLIPSRVTSKSSKKRGRKSLSESHYFLKKKSQKIHFLRVIRLRHISWSKGWYFVSEIVNFGKKRKLFSLFVVFWHFLDNFVYNWCGGVSEMGALVLNSVYNRGCWHESFWHFLRYLILINLVMSEFKKLAFSGLVLEVGGKFVYNRCGEVAVCI